MDGTISDEEICLGHYQMFRRDQSRHGGVVVSIAKTCSVRVLQWINNLKE